MFVEAVLEREAVTDHDVAAFVDVVQDRIGGPEASWIHYGLTSTDVVDTALCWAMRDAATELIAASTELLHTLVDLARAHRDTVMIGRTHGIHAEPTTFGAKAALWALQVDRDRSRLTSALATVSVMKLSGAVGTYSNIPPEVEAHVGRALGLSPVPATQVVARDRHAEFLWACAAVGTTCEAVAVELRHLQRTEVSEVREGFKPGQKGSSAMPHKRNPISAETISGLARVLQGKSAGRAPGRGLVARARHLAFVGRACRSARFVTARALRDAASHATVVGTGDLAGANVAKSTVEPRPRVQSTGSPRAGTCGKDAR